MKNTYKIGNKVLAFVLISALMLTAAGCKKRFDRSKKVGIHSLDIIAATGNKDNWNDYSLHNQWNDGEYSATMRSETAMKLIGEINKLPDVLGEEDGKYAYEIELVYYDENSEKQFATKCGFDGFPDNWGTIVSYANEITPDYLNDGGLTDSTDIVSVDKDFLKANFDFSEDMLPDGVTAEQFIEEAGLTYEKISSSFRMDRCVREFKYAYYDFVSHRIKKDTRPSPSDMDSLKQYAEKNLDSIDSYEEYSVRGRFKDGGYEIVRFDCFEEWKREKGVTGDTVNPKDETLDIFYERDAGMEDMKYIDDYFVYVDPSNRFLIITQCIDYDLIKELINRT